ncbi:MAG: FHA domain-containing protein [Myxococcales bacterium]|nr:FHA domain-containing protein [Myxococcales bacterium]
MAEKTCSQCGAEVPKGHQFCGNCGATTGSATDIGVASKDTGFFSPLQMPGRAKLIVIKGVGGDGISYALNASDHVAGRDAGVILFPDDPSLSKEHANFLYREHQLYLRDMGSDNGTFLRVRGDHHLSDGDLFSCGQQLFRVEIPDSRTEFPDDEGTLLYVSPSRHERLRVMQILDGGLPGKVAASPHGELTVGRQGCDLTVEDDNHMSKRHARLTLERDGRILLADLGSKNGTFIRIKGETQLRHGDYVFIGQELLRVEIVE